VPRDLYMAIVKVQAAENLNLEQACIRVTELYDHGSEQFTKRVKEEARKLHNRELLTELNKGRKTIEKNAEERGMNYAKILSPCSVCGKNMVFDLLNEQDKKNIMDMLKKGGIDSWQHTRCRTPTS
jgi:hypothetical protein